MTAFRKLAPAFAISTATLLAFFVPPAGAATTDLFISEYIEGSSFNKAIEIYNGTGAGVDLGGYSLELYSNGSATVSQSMTLSGTLANGDVLVLAHGSADAAILAVADVTNSSVINFNGDDAVVLRKSGVVVDAFGQVGFDPGSEWPGGGQDDTLRRNANVCAGDTDASNAFDASVEWGTWAQNTFDGLGSHAASCGASPDQVFINELRISGSPDAEFFELQGPASTSLDGLSYIVLSGEFSPGQIDDVVDLSGLSIPADGFFVAANTTAATEYGITPDLSDALSFFGSPTTHMLVRGFTGAAGDDLDSDNDGVLDTTPWDAVVDAVSLVDGDATTDYSYSTDVVGPDGSFTPAGTFRCPDAPGGTFDNNQLTFGTLDGTPGEANECVPPPPPSVWIINEVHADPDTTNGDANGDGAAQFSDDEFVEIVNISGADVDISGWTLSDGFGIRHTFPAGSVVENDCSIVVFGGGAPTGSFGFSAVQTASTGALGLNNGGDVVTLNNGASDVASVSYGSEGGDNQSLTRDPDITGSDPLVKHATATGSAGALFSPGTLIDGSGFSGCTVVAVDVKIHDVQGTGAVSPLAGQLVAIEGIVVGDFQDGAAGTHGDLNGFFVQEEDADADGDALTSEGIFIFDGSSPAVNVANGDQVRVEGMVSEFNGMTEISSFGGVSVVSSGNALPTATPVTLPVVSLDAYETTEGMLVTFPQSLVIAEYFNFDRYGEIVLADQRLHQPTAVFDPGSADAADLASLNALSQITLDDGRTAQNPDPAIHPNGGVFDLGNLFRGGDTVTNLTGVMNYLADQYRVQPIQGAVYASVNARTAAPDDAGGNLSVASFNVLNYFNGDGLGGGFPTSRGADDLDEFIRQRDKIIAAIVAIDADVVGVIEIENDGYGALSAIQDLVNGLNDATAPGTWDFVDPGVPAIGTDEIAVGLVYKPATVSLEGNSAILDSSVDPDFIDTLNRPALAQTFSHNLTGDVVTVAVNHLKSKGSPCDDVGDPDTGDGAGNCNLTRTAAAMALADWLAGDPTGSGTDKSLIIGDLNSYDKEDPVFTLTSAGYTDLIALFGGEFAYSYLFSAQLGYLDHALASPGLLDQVTGAGAWHINADEPDLINYDTTFKQPAQDALYAPDPYRSSDHDPVIVGIEMHYDFAGFFSPLMNPPALNPAKSGRSVPVKFSLNGDYGLDILAAGYPQSREIHCDTGEPTGAAEPTEASGGSGLVYDPETDQYLYSWKTQRDWAGSCRELIVKLNDGAAYTAWFEFR